VEGLPVITGLWVAAFDIAAHLGVARGSDRWIAKKGPPAHEMGRLLMYEVTDVDEWVRQGGAAQDNEHDQEKHG
jgi:hypothetical protein